jgi:uncharacterized phage-associated protein
MYNIKLIAKYIIWLFYQADESITNMKLQKLCYFAQAWYLGNYHKPLFQEDFQAWVYGPVCPKLYRQYKKFGKNEIDSTIDIAQFNVISEDDKEYLNDVTGIYDNFSAIELMLMSHEDKPWLIARKDCTIDEPCYNIINKNDIEEYYMQLVNDSQN